MNNIASPNIAVPQAGSMGIPLFRTGAVFALIMLFVAAATIISRRLAGALVDPLQPTLFLSAGAMVVVAAAVVRIGWSRTTSRGGWIVMAVTSLTVLSLFAALCLPGTSTTLIAAVGAMLATEEIYTWLRAIRRDRKPRFSKTVGHATNVANLETDDSDFDSPPGEEVTQKIVRSLTADGTEVLSGWLRADFSAGQRSGSVHVAFCPPLRSAPEVKVEQIAGPESRIRTAQVLPYGVRLDLKLSAPVAEPTGLLLQFSAVSTRDKQPAP